MVEAITKVVSAMTMQSCLTSSRGTQYQGASSYIGRPRQPQLAHGPDRTLQPSVTCFYCKDTRHIKDNCVWLNNKIVCEWAQEQATVTGKSHYKNQVLHLKYQKNNGFSDLGPVLMERRSVV